MGAYYGAEVCDLIGLLILSKIEKSIPGLQFGLYRDDGLAVYKTSKGIHIDSMRKKLIEIFKSLELNIFINTRMHKVDMLDVTFNLADNNFKPFRKENDSPSYIHKESNHPPNIIKKSPKSLVTDSHLYPPTKKYSTTVQTITTPL